MANETAKAREIGIGAVAYTHRSGAPKSTTSEATAEYAEILAAKLASIDDDLKRLEKERETIKEIDTLRRDAEERGTLNPSVAVPETVKRVMGDGTILVTTTENGKIVEQYRKKPHLVPVPNDAAPKNALPSEKVKWVPRQNPLDLLEFA